MKSRRYHIVFLFLLLLGGHSFALAQNESVQLARAQKLLSEKQFAQALPILRRLYKQAPFDKDLYDQYRSALIDADSFQQAEALVRYMMQIRRGDPAMLVDLGWIMEQERKRKAARKQYEAAIAQMGTNSFRIKGLASAFENYGKYEYAAEVFEKARVALGNPYLFATQLSLLYTRIGNTKKAIQATLDLAMGQINILDEVKTSLATIAQKDPKGFSMIRKELEDRLEAQPQNPFWNSLMSWLFVQKGAYEDAMDQLISLDKKLDEKGKQLMLFAEECLQDKEYAVALKSYNYILASGSESPFYQQAFKGKIQTMRIRFEASWPDSRSGLPALKHQFKAYFVQYPNDKTTELWRQYARIYARYDGQADTAIQMLQEAIALPGAVPVFIGRCKLDMGDYQVLVGRVWEATLLYAQVDKAFKEDYLGEQARFRNARLAYYRGDFAWAQGQLSVLKASSTRLIANDALYLSILITENLSPDSNSTPLLLFAKADLLLFQHRTSDSEQLLDSISKTFPQTPLQDDIAMLQAKIAMEEGRWDTAVRFLQDILENYGTDILGDDAALKLARIYKDHLKNKEKALYYYEQLITGYPGSTYIQEARKEYRDLQQDNPGAS